MTISPSFHCGYSTEHLKGMIEKCNQNDSEATQMLKSIIRELLAFRKLYDSRQVESTIERKTDEARSWARSFITDAEEKVRKAKIRTRKVENEMYQLRRTVESLTTQLSDAKEDLEIAERNAPSERIVIEIKNGRIRVDRKEVKR